MLYVRLPEGIGARLDKLAKASGRSKASHVREAIVEYLEDREDWRLAQAEYARVLAGRSRTVPLETFFR